MGLWGGLRMARGCKGVRAAVGLDACGVVRCGARFVSYASRRVETDTCVDLCVHDLRVCSAGTGLGLDMGMCSGGGKHEKRNPCRPLLIPCALRYGSDESVALYVRCIT